MAESGSKNGWTRVAFGDVVRQVRDRVDPEDSGLKRYIAGEHMDTDDLRIRRWGRIGDGYLGPAFNMRFKPGHVLYGSRRTYLRKVAVADFEGITANTTFVIESKNPTMLLPELLPFIMQSESFHEHSINQSKGSVNPYINFSDIAWYEFGLPSLEEQRSIYSVVAAATSVLNNLSNCIERCAAIVSSIRTSQFDPARHKPVALAQLCDDGDGIQIGPFGAELHQSDYRPDGVPVVMPMNIRDDRIATDGIARVSERKARSLEVHRLQQGDILLPRRGELDKRAFVEESAVGWLCGTGSVRVRVQSQMPFLAVFHALASPHSVCWLNVHAVGTTMPNLNTTIVGNVPIALPPASVLGAIIAALQGLDSGLTTLRNRRAAVHSVRQRILATALGTT